MGHSSEKYDIFYYEGLIPQLKPTFVFPQADGNTIEIPQGSYAIPFHFSIPSNALESYRGKNAHITRWKKDYHHTISFVVVNPRMAYKLGDRYYLDNSRRRKKVYPTWNWSLKRKMLV